MWNRHVGDPVLASNRTRRVDFALFMVHALEDDALVHEAPAIVGRLTVSALAHAPESGSGAAATAHGAPPSAGRPPSP